MDVYDRYKFCVEDSMDIGQLLKFMEMEEPVYFLFKKNNEVGNEITVCEKVIINDIRDVENSFSSEMTDKSLTLYFLSGKYSERNKIIRFSGNGKHFIFLKNKPGERFVKISIDNMVQQGLYCGECKYCRNEKIFVMSFQNIMMDLVFYF